jgi:hypothetical protein
LSLLFASCESEKLTISIIPFDIQFFTPVTPDNFSERQECEHQVDASLFGSVLDIEGREPAVELSVSGGIRLKVQAGKKLVYISRDNYIITQERTYKLSPKEIEYMQKNLANLCQ